MDSNLAQPWKKAVSSDDSRDSNAAPSNSCVSGPQPAHHVNCEDEKKSDALKTNAMETTMKTQSNNGYGEGTNDGIRFGNSSEGLKESFMTNRHFHANGLNDKKAKVEGKEMTNRPLQVNGLNNKNSNVVAKEKENSPLQGTGLNNKYIEMAAEWNGSQATAECKLWTQRAEWNESRVETEYKYGNRRQMESEYGRRRSNYNQDQHEWRNDDQSRMRKHQSDTIFTVSSVYDEGSEDEYRFLQINSLNEENPVYKLEGILRICNQDIQTLPDMFGVMKRNPRVEHNPLLCNLKDRDATRITTKAVTEILHKMLSKIPEYQAECETISGIGSHRITRFDLVETEVIQERIKAILNGSRSGRRIETLAHDELPVYDEGTKEYLESNRLLDYVSEFLWKAREKADRPLQVDGLNETKPTYNSSAYRKEKVETGNYETSQYSSDYKREKSHLTNYNHSPLPNSFRISRNRPQHGDEYYYKPSNLSESFITLPANNEIGLRGLSPSQTIRGRRVRMARQLSTSLSKIGGFA